MAVDRCCDTWAMPIKRGIAVDLPRATHSEDGRSLPHLAVGRSTTFAVGEIDEVAKHAKHAKHGHGSDCFRWLK